MNGRLVVPTALSVALVFGGCATDLRPSPPGHQLEDRPVSLGGDDLDKTEGAIAKLIAESRAELPQVRSRFMAGLRPGETLYLTIRFYKADRSFEQAFAEVKEWRLDGISGVLASSLVAFDEPKAGDRLEFTEDMVVDWTIIGPGGSEAGNRVGHYLDRAAHAE